MDIKKKILLILALLTIESTLLFAQEPSEDVPNIELLQGKWKSKFLFGDSGTVVDTSQFPQFLMTLDFDEDELQLYSKLNETTTTLQYRLNGKIIHCYRDDSTEEEVLTMGVVSLSKESLVVIVNKLNAKLLFDRIK